jgi:hypothetical protein
MITWTGCDSAIVGVVARCGLRSVVCYEFDKLVEHFVAQGMSEEEAIEWIDFNILGSYVGEDTPMLLYRGDILTCEEMLNA